MTYLNTEYAGDASFSNPILGGPPISVDGNDLMRSPPWKAYVGGQYDWETNVGQFTVRADMTYSDSFYFDVFQASLPNQKEMEQDAYSIYNAHIAWESTDGKYSSQLFCQNISDEEFAYSSQAVGTTGSVMSQYSAPRTYGIRGPVGRGVRCRNRACGLWLRPSPQQYDSSVYRALVMFPRSADPIEVDALIEGIASAFKASAGSQPITHSVGSLMGPGAKAGAAGWILEANFSTLEDAMTALQAEDFQDPKARTEALGSTIFLFEVQEI